MASRETPLPPLALDGSITVGSGCPEDCAQRRSGAAARGGRGPGSRGRDSASRASAPGTGSARSFLAPRLWLARARPRRSCFLLARRLCFGDTRVFRSPERVERSQALHCSRVSACPAASAGRHTSPVALTSYGPAAAICNRLPSPHAVN